MKKLLVVGLMMSSFVFGQNKEKDSLIDRSSDKGALVSRKKPEPLSKKGQMFVFFGWNRAAFSNSDIRFTGNGYDFQLNNVSAQDRPTKFGIVYINPGWFTVVQYNFRAGYFIKDNYSISLGWEITTLPEFKKSKKNFKSFM